MKNTLIITLLFITFISFGQDNYLLGKWTFEKIPDHIEIDEKGLEMANSFFKDMTMSFDAKNYTQSIMGKSESGTWLLLSENNYEFNSSKGYKYEVEIKKVSDTQIIFKHETREFQLLKSDEKASIEVQEKAIDKIEGIIINTNDLIGKWLHNGQIKKGKDNGIILNHKKGEIVSYTFKENGEFFNKAPFEIELLGLWKIEDDKKTLVIESDEMSEFFKIVKLTEAELHLYNPKNESVIKFKKG